MNIPNIITGIRFLMVPVFGYYLYINEYKIAVFLFIIAGFTDVLDGYIARKYNMVTSWGKIADPLADKLMQITALLLLTIHKIIPIFILAIVLAKEILMGVGSLLLYKHENVVASANWYGKLATVVFYFAIILAMFSTTYGNLAVFEKLFIGLALVATLFAFFMYFLTYQKIRKMSKQ